MLEKEVLNFEKTAIVGIVTQNQSEEKLNEYLDELELLTFTAGVQVVKRFSQKMERPNPKTFVGTGKMEEIHQFVKENDISTLIFDDELSPSQQKNISKISSSIVITTPMPIPVFFIFFAISGCFFPIKYTGNPKIEAIIINFTGKNAP